MPLASPDRSNRFHQEHVQTLLDSYRHWVGRDLLTPSPDLEQTARRLYLAPFVVLSHNASPDPRFTYGNAAALRLFELEWDDLLRMHSRDSAEPDDQAKRARLLERVAERGFVADYSGVRITARGKRFRISAAVVWNLRDADGGYCGQAASFAQWEFI